MGLNNKAQLLNLLIVGALALTACKESGASSATEEKQPSAREAIDSYPAALRTALTRKILLTHGKDELTLSEVSKFDFSPPQSPNYRDDQRFSVFPKNSADLSSLQAVETRVSNGGRYVITLSNRVSGSGTDQPELLVILPKVKEDVCKSAARNAIGSANANRGAIKIPKLSHAPNLLGFPQKAADDFIVTLPIAKLGYGCIKANDQFYYYQIVHEF